MTSARTKPVALISEDATPTDRVRTLLAFSLCVDHVSDDEPLDKFNSLDLVEAVVVCERTLGLKEIDDERLLKCQTIGRRVGVIVAGAPA